MYTSSQKYLATLLSNIEYKLKQKTQKNLLNF